MKKTNLKKLTLKKNVIASFGAAEMNQAVGGEGTQTDRCFLTMNTRTFCPDTHNCLQFPPYTATPEC